jgi:hypothetical protein
MNFWILPSTRPLWLVLSVSTVRILVFASQIIAPHLTGDLIMLDRKSTITVLSTLMATAISIETE